jgi:Family of unknown function (DUF6339)
MKACDVTNVVRYAQRLTLTRLLKALDGESLPVEHLAQPVELEVVRAAVLSVPEGLRGSELDQALVEPFHRGMSGLTRADAADMRVWHWLAADQFPVIVWRRWRTAGSPQPADLEASLTEAMIPHFAGSSTLVGVSRNTFSRLWWTAEGLDGDYDLARFALSRQDMFVSVFERLFGVYSPAARACLEVFRGRSEGEIRRASEWLNYAAATTLIEALDADDIKDLLGEALQA